MSDTQTHPSELVGITADIVSAYVSNNHVQSGEMSKLISEVHSALVGLGSGGEVAKETQSRATASEIRRSVTPEHLVSFEDGKHYKTLRRHLTIRGLTPEQYRAKWGLPSDYPMTSLKYSEQRSELARSLGLGQQRRKGTAAPEAAPAPEPETETAPKGGRGRPRKAA